MCELSKRACADALGLLRPSGVGSYALRADTKAAYCVGLSTEVVEFTGLKFSQFAGIASGDVHSGLEAMTTLILGRTADGL